MRLVLVRHGESIWNAEGRYQGHADPGLTERGRAQATVTARLLAREYADADLLLRSDLQRVAETAALTEAVLDVDVSVDERLREIDLGTWSGLTREEVAERDPEGFQAWTRCEDASLLRRGGGETYAELRERVWSVLREVSRGDGNVLIFTHGGPIRAAVAAALGLTMRQEVRLAGVGNCSLTLLEWRSDLPRLFAYNRTCHLRACLPAGVPELNDRPPG